VALAIGIGFGFGVAPAILVLAAGALVGVIGLFWASLRTLAGEAPLAEGLASAAAARENVDPIGQRKQRVLRALKDLELEHTVGKIDDEDYAEISTRYRDQAKAIFREMDLAIEPYRPQAEALVRAHLKKKAIAGGEASDAKGTPLETAPDASLASPARVDCASCGTSNERDAKFCKKCRARLDRVACPSCRASNEPDAAFCKKCGASLNDEKQEATASEAKGV
jgi:hypothetical protein